MKNMIFSLGLGLIVLNPVLAIAERKLPTPAEQDAKVEKERQAQEKRDAEKAKAHLWTSSTAGDGNTSSKKKD